MCDFEIEGKKVLEVGCGLSLPSLVLSQRLADITCTDYHPEAESFLRVNTTLNAGKEIPFFLSNWATISSPEEKFDLILGSDLLYERGHDALLSAFLDRHANAKCEIIIVDPGRGYLNRFTSKMRELSFSYIQAKPKDQSYLTAPFKGTINSYTRSGKDFG